LDHHLRTVATMDDLGIDGRPNSLARQSARGFAGRSGESIARYAAVDALGNARRIGWNRGAKHDSLGGVAHRLVFTAGDRFAEHSLLREHERIVNSYEAAQTQSFRRW